MAGQNKYGPPGLWHTPSYQSSGSPWITGSMIDDGFCHRVQFERVPKSFTVICTGSSETPIQVHFQSGTVDGPVSGPGMVGQQLFSTTSSIYTSKHYITVPGNSGSITMNVKCKEVYVSAVHGQSGYQIFAELTSISTSSMFHLTGSGIDAQMV
jgi:hypothetical protein